MNVQRGRRRFGVAVLVVASWLVACSPDPATEIVVRIDSDIGPELTGITVVLDQGVGTPSLLSQTFALATSGGSDGGTFTLPGTIAVLPSSGGRGGLVRAQVTALTTDPSHVFTTTVSTAFAPQRTLVLDVFLAARCEDAMARACPDGQTCGAGGCVPISQPSTPYDQDAARMDGAAEMDAPPDVDAVTPIDAPIATDALDVPTDLPADLPAPRQLAPLSTSTVTLATPSLHWSPPPAGASGTEVQICADRPCTSVRQTTTAASGATSTRVPTALPARTWFWRIRSIGCAASTGCTWSPVWQFAVGHGTAATHDGSFGTLPDLDGDGNGDIVAGEPGVLGGHIVHAIGAVIGYLGPTLTPSIPFAPPGDASQMSLGTSVVSVGDMNGDGFGDFVVGSQGSAYLFVGPISTTTTAAETWTAHGAIAGVGDVNGDGYADVVITDPAGRAGTVMFYAGGVHLPAVGTPLVIPVAVGVTGFGVAVAGAGDVDGDGYADVLVAASGNARVYLLPGSAMGLTTTPGASFTGPGLEATFGTALAGAGDVDGDGLADVTVGAPDRSSNTSAVFVYRGNAATYLTTAMPWRVYDPTHQGGTAFGAAIAMGGDVDGDGRGDVVVGAPTTGSGSGTGATYVVRFGATGTPTATALHATLATPAAFGTAVAMLDYNDDGLTDVLASDVRGDPVGCTVYAYLAGGGASGTPSRSINMPLSGPPSDFGISLALARRAGRIVALR